MFKKLILILLILSLLTPLYSKAELTYERYGEKEFPIWTMKLRRAESLFFGSLVFTFPLSTLLLNTLESSNIITLPNEAMDRFLITCATASAFSLTLSTADWIIGEISD